MAKSARRDIFKVRLKCILWAINLPAWVSNVNPFSPLNFLALLMVINSVFIVSGAAGFARLNHSAGEERETRGLNKWKSGIIIIKIEYRDTHLRDSRRCDKRSECFQVGEKFLIKTEPASIRIALNKLNFLVPSIIVAVVKKISPDNNGDGKLTGGKRAFWLSQFPPTWRDIISPHLKIIQLSDKRLLPIASFDSRSRVPFRRPTV